MGNILKMSFLKGSQPAPKLGDFHFSKQEKNSSQLPPELPSPPPRPFSSQNPTYFTTRACPGAAPHVLGGCLEGTGPPGQASSRAHRAARAAGLGESPTPRQGLEDSSRPPAWLRHSPRGGSLEEPMAARGSGQGLPDSAWCVTGRCRRPLGQGQLAFSSLKRTKALCVSQARGGCSRSGPENKLLCGDIEPEISLLNVQPEEQYPAARTRVLNKYRGRLITKLQTSNSTSLKSPAYFKKNISQLS